MIFIIVCISWNNK